MAQLSNVLYETKGSIAYVTLNRPKVLNALSQGAWADLKSAFEQARDAAEEGALAKAGAPFLCPVTYFAALDAAAKPGMAAV